MGSFNILLFTSLFVASLFDLFRKSHGSKEEDTVDYYFWATCDGARGGLFPVFVCRIKETYYTLIRYQENLEALFYDSWRSGPI